MQDSKDNINQAYASWGNSMMDRIDEDIDYLKKLAWKYGEEGKGLFRIIDDMCSIQRLIKENFI